MTNHSTPTPPAMQSDLAEEHAAMLEAALARPGVREFMEVYGNWQERDQEHSSYRSATTNANLTVTSTSSHTL